MDMIFLTSHHVNSLQIGRAICRVV